MISQIDRLSSKETKIAGRSIWIAVDASARSAATCMVVSRVGGLATSLCRVRRSLSRRPWDLSPPNSLPVSRRTCVKTPARFHTDLFCSLFRALRPLGSEKIAKNFALRDCLQKFAGFSHGLGREHAIAATCTRARPGPHPRGRASFRARPAHGRAAHQKQDRRAARRGRAHHRRNGRTAGGA